MLYKKSGIPEEGDLVLCTVKKILYHSVFVSLDEYKVLEGMVHISEIAPGRIRNLRDYVREEKQIICKVLRVDKIKGHIDLSLRRVNDSARAKKLNEFKQEEKAEKILEQVARKLGTNLEDVYKNAGAKIVETYGLLSPCLYDVVLNGDKSLKALNIPDKYSEAIVAVVKERITIPQVKVSKNITIENHSSTGIVSIKDVLLKAIDFAKAKGMEIEIRYLGAPRYQVDAKAVDYKSANEQLDSIMGFITKGIVAAGGNAETPKK